MKEKTAELFNYVRDHGGRVTTDELCEALGVKINSITGRIRSLCTNGLAVYTKKEGENPGVVELTDAGKDYTPEVDAE